MILEIAGDERTVDIRLADIFEVIKVEDGHIFLQRVFQRTKTVQEPVSLGISVSDGVGMSDKVG